jgi:hypothetical protein
MSERRESGELRMAKILARCIEAQRRGMSIESILTRYPEEAIELRPLLEIAEMLRTRRQAANGCDKNQPAPR